MSGYLDRSGLSYLWSKITSKLSGKSNTHDSIKNITRSGSTFTATRADDTTFTFDQLRSLISSNITINTTSTVSSVNISSLGYSSSTDMIQVYINGLKLTSSEYSISGSNLTLTLPLPANNILEIVVTKIG